MAIVPLVVIGEPLTESPVGTETATDVTVPVFFVYPLSLLSSDNLVGTVTFMVFAAELGV